MFATDENSIFYSDFILLGYLLVLLKKGFINEGFSHKLESRFLQAPKPVLFG